MPAPAPRPAPTAECRHCQLCGKPLTGRYHVVRHALWTDDQRMCVCSVCLAVRARCSQCNLPISQDASTTGSMLCPTCAESLPHCLACGKQITGKQYLRRHSEQGPYCANCIRVRPKCDICGMPQTNRRWQLADGRVVCEVCNHTAVYTQQQADQLYKMLRLHVQQILGLATSQSVALYLIDRNEMAARLRQVTLPRPELATNINQVLGLFARFPEVGPSIFMQTGLPRLIFLQIAGHEYAHAWQHERCPDLDDLLKVEGFAEWVAYRVLGAYRADAEQAIMRDRTDLYGQGLAWALALDAQGGPAAVLRACQHATPAGGQP